MRQGEDPLRVGVATVGLSTQMLLPTGGLYTWNLFDTCFG